MNQVKSFLLCFLISSYAYDSFAVLIDFNSVTKIKKFSCQEDNINFKKELWESDLAEKVAYSKNLGIKNECLSHSDQVYVEIYYQYKNEKIILSKAVELKLLQLIEEENIEEDLLNLISWLFEKIENFKNEEINQAWEV